MKRQKNRVKMIIDVVRVTLGIILVLIGVTVAVFAIVTGHFDLAAFIVSTLFMIFGTFIIANRRFAEAVAYAMTIPF